MFIYNIILFKIKKKLENLKIIHTSYSIHSLMLNNIKYSYILFKIKYF